MAQRRTFHIETPRGSLYQSKGKNGKVTARLEWNAGFGQQYSQGFRKAQEFLIQNACAIRIL